jgi:HAD superfamily hydrolase (TIGR01549 family)
LLSPNGIRAVCFDLDGTLRYSRPTFAEAFFNIAMRLGVSFDLETRRSASRWLLYYWAKSDELVSDREFFGGQNEAFWRNHARLCLEELGCTPGQARDLAPEASQRMTDEFKPQDWVPPDVPLTLQALKSAGFSLAVLSNRSKPYSEQLETLDLAGYFDFVLHAGEVGGWKPDVHIFQQAIERLGIQPSQSLYVGDNYYADVVGSSRAGMKPVLLDPEGLFPEADCPVISKIGDLLNWLQVESSKLKVEG